MKKETKTVTNTVTVTEYKMIRISGTTIFMPVDTTKILHPRV